MKFTCTLFSLLVIYVYIIMVCSWRNPRPSIRLISSSKSSHQIKQIQLPTVFSSTRLHFKTSSEDEEGSTAVEYDENGEKSPAQLKAERILLLKRISKGIIPLAASMGFAITPSSRAILRIAGAAAGGVAGLLAKQAVEIQIDTLKKPETSTSSFDGDDGDDNNNDGDGEFTDRMLEFPQKVNVESIKEVKAKPAIDYPGWEYSDSGTLRDNSLIPAEVALAVERTFTKYKKIEDFELRQLEVIAKASKVSSKDLGLYFSLLLSEYIYQFTDNDSLNLLEFKTLFQFIKKIDFSFSEIADAITLAANNIGKKLSKDEFGFYSEQFPIQQYLQACKLYYLSDKLIGTFQGYYGQRAQTALAIFPHDEYRKVITEACSQLFIDVLTRILEVPEKYNSKKFEELKYLLTTSSEASDFTVKEVEDFISQIFLNMANYYLRINAEDRTIYTVSLPSMNEITKLQQIFGWEYSNIQKVFEPVTSPLYRNIVKDIFSKVTADSSLGESFLGTLEERMKALHLPLSIAKEIVKKEIEELNVQAVNNIMSVFKKSNENVALTYRQIVSYAIALEEIAKLTKNIFPGVKPLSITQFPISQSDQVMIYTMNLLQRENLQHKLNPEVLDEMFEVSKDTLNTVYRLLIVPKIVEFIQQCIRENNFSEPAKAAYQKRWKEEGFTEEEWEEVAIAVYYEHADVIGKNSKIPSVEEMNKLEQITGFLNMSSSLVEQVHVAVFGEKFLKATEECMSTTGVITPEYMDSLERLQQRLKISNTDAGNIYSIAIMNRFGPNIYAIYDLFKSITDPTFDVNKEKQRRRKEQIEEQKKRNKFRKKNGFIEDDGKSDNLSLEEFEAEGGGGDDEDDEFQSKYSKPLSLVKKQKEEDNYPIIGTEKTEFMKSIAFLQRRDKSTEVQRSTFMKEVINLVDFIHENYQMQNFDFLAKEDYPIRATEFLNASEIIDVYRYFVTSKLLESNPSLKQRYDDADSKFGNLLGIPWETRNDVKQLLLQDIYATTIRNLLETKDAIEPADLQQFYVLADEFNVTEPDLRHDLQEYVIRRGIDDYANSFLTPNDEEDDAPEAKLNPAQARRFRKQIESFGYKFIEFYEDKPADFFYSYYAYEIKYLIETNQISEIAELQDIYDFTQEESINIIQNVCKRMIDELLNLALRASRRYEEEDCLSYLREILRYFLFLADEPTIDFPVNGRLFQEIDLIRLLQFYGTYLENEKLSKQINADGNRSDIQQNEFLQLQDEAELLNKLKTKIYFTNDYNAPERGMAGLLGTYKTRKEIEAEQSKKVQTNVKQSKQQVDFSG